VQLKHYDYYITLKKFIILIQNRKYWGYVKDLKPESYKEIPVISLYYNVLMLHLREEDASYFFKVKEQIEDIEKSINKYEIADTYINLENYCRKRIRKGDKSFLNGIIWCFERLKLKKVYTQFSVLCPQSFTGALLIRL